jgi:hypothetical protein
VNRPSVEAPRPDHGWGNSHHTQSFRKGKKGSVGKGEKRGCKRQGSQKKTGGALEIQGVLNRGEGE